MSAKLLDGKLVADMMLDSITQRVDFFKKQNKRIPGLAVIIVGDDPASKIYVRNKRLACQRVGFHSVAFDLPSNTSQDKLENIIQELNKDEKIDGILVQTPLPSHLDTNRIIEHIRHDKDVDGFHPFNVGSLVLRKPQLRPCTPYGIIKLLEHYEIDLKGINAVIIGASNTVGRPMALELLLQKATVTVCHKYTKNLKSLIKNADLLIVAIGKQNQIATDWLPEGIIVVDVGINRLPDGKICGDIDFKTAVEKASWITPVPGGVGPMTVATLLDNTLFAAEHFHRSAALTPALSRE